MNNYGVSFATGEYILLLNNDTQVITVNWMEELLMYAQRQDVAAVGAKLYYADKTIQHAGVVLGAWGTPDGGTQPLRPAAGRISAIWEDSAMRRMYRR